MEEKIEQEINELEQELAIVRGELKVIESSIIKGMNNDLYKELMLEKAQVEKDISEVEIEIKMLKDLKEKGISLEDADAYFEGSAKTEETETEETEEDKTETEY